MYIGHKKTKNKYQLYLCHSKRINGKSKKLINQYLCSIEKEDLKHREYEDENSVRKYIFDEFKSTVLLNAKKVPEYKRQEVEDEFNWVNILSIFLAKIKKLEAIENKL